MTSSDPYRERAARILSQLSILLDEAYIAQQVDEPIERAFADFDLSGAVTYSHGRLHRSMSDLVQHLYAQGLPSGRKLSRSQAHDEAIALLLGAYAPDAGDGYDHAILDATDADMGGMPIVLATIVEAMKAKQRRMYIRRVEAQYIEPADWPTRCAIAGLLLERCRDVLPHHLRDASVEQMAGQLWDFLEAYVATWSQAWQVFSAPSLMAL